MSYKLLSFGRQIFSLFRRFLSCITWLVLFCNIDVTAHAKKKKTDTIFKKKPSKNSLPEKCQLKIAQCWMTPVTRILPSASCDAGWIKMVLRRHAFNCTHSWPSYCSIWFTSCSDPVPDCKDGFRSVIWFRLMGPPYFLSLCGCIESWLPERILTDVCC